MSEFLRLNVKSFYIHKVLYNFVIIFIYNSGDLKFDLKPSNHFSLHFLCTQNVPNPWIYKHRNEYVLPQSSEEGNGNLLQSFCLEILMDRGGLQTIVHGVSD